MRQKPLGWWVAIAMLASCGASMAHAQEGAGRIIGRVTVAVRATPAVGALVTLEGTALRAVTDSGGRYVLAKVPPGPYMLVVRRIGLAPARIAITVPPRGTVVQDAILAETALRMPEIVVTADAVGRARGEQGTASVVDRDAIVQQTATTVYGVLELVPGVSAQAPGLDNVQQIALRSLETSEPASFTAGGPTAEDIASFGTLIVLDGVPMTNNANLQTTGPRGELEFLLPSSAGGGVDLRRIPASTLERVEVIRGIPSVRYGDLTQGAIVVDTRAAAAAPQFAARVDQRTFEGSAVGGHRFGGGRHAVTGAFDAAYSRLQPGLTADDATRVAVQLAHHLALGADWADPTREPSALDTRVDLSTLQASNPERPEVFPGRASSSEERGLRVSERLSLPWGSGGAFRATASIDYLRQRSHAQALRLRSALPFTDRLTEGQAVGHYLDGEYLSEFSLAGDAWQLYGRAEADRPFVALGLDHRVLGGLELRREWNDGAGYQFDIERPPQVTFNGVEGFDRPRRFNDVPPVATSAFYLDDRLRRTFGDVTVSAQVGLRVDLLHRGTTWFSRVRDEVWQPRANLEVAPWPWFRLRGAIGRTAKTPASGSLYPPPQYFDVVNVNWYTTDPAERLAVLTTFVRDPTNADLGFAVGTKRELGLQVSPGRRGFALDVALFHDGVSGAIGLQRTPGFLVRDLFDLVDSTTGTGRPPTLVLPSTRADTVPILVVVPANVLSLDNRGVEGTIELPEIRPAHLRFLVQGAWVRTLYHDPTLDFGQTFGAFQVDGSQARAPYWIGITRRSERTLFTYRAVHHRPDLGLVITAAVEHIAHEVRKDSAAVDTLAFEGYIDRAGALTPVPVERRGDPEYADLRVARSGAVTASKDLPADWFLSLQVSKTLPWDGRLSFYAFNALDRQGRIASPVSARVFAPLRFGLEMAFTLRALGGE